MSIQQVWKEFNVSTIMVLPLFWDITRNIFARGTQTVYPFQQLCMEYGLVNTYLLLNDEFSKCLYLEFDKLLFNEDLELTTSKYYSMCELLVDCDYFHNIIVTEDTIIIALRIPGRFVDDIKNHIMKGKYSSVSNEYKKELKIKEISIPIGENKLAAYISTNDLAYAVSIKARHIKEEIENILDLEISVEDEFYQKMDIIKETCYI